MELSDDAHLTSDVCLSVAYIGSKSRTERPRKTKIGTEVAHITRGSDTTVKVKRSKVNLHGQGILWRPPAQLVKICLKNAIHHIRPFKVTQGRWNRHGSIRYLWFPINVL